MPTTYSSADAITDVAAADYLTLQARFRILANVVDIVSAERQAICKRMKAMEDIAAAKLRIGALSEADKEVYRQALESRE